MRRKLLVALLALVLLLAGGYYLLQWLLVSDLMRTELERQLSAYLQQPVTIKSARAAIFPRVAIALDTVVVGSQQSIALEDVRIVTGLRPLLSRRVEQAEVRVRNGRLTLPLPFTLTPEVGPAVAEPTGFALASIESIELRGITLVSGGQEWQVDADCAVTGDRLDVSQLTASGPTTKLEATGTLTSISGLQGQFTAQAEPLGVDELLAFGGGLSRGPAGGSAPAPSSTPMNLVVALTAPAGRFAGYDFRGLTTTAAITPAGLALAPLGVSSFGGTFAGRLDVDTRRSVPAMKLAGRVDGLELATVLQAAGSQGGVTGTFGGRVSLSAAGTDTLALLRSARGSVAATIVNGTMPHLDLVRPIVLAFGKPSGAPPQGSGSTFSRLGGNFALADGTMTSDDVTMASRDFDLAGRGTVHIASGALSARANVVLSSELTAQAGVDLRRYAQEDGRVVVPATLAGTLQQPTVSLDVAAAARRALTNELERRTRSLLDGLFKRKK
jgi:AsmA-like C-terminal region